MICEQAVRWKWDLGPVGGACTRLLEPTHSKRKYPHRGTLSLQNTKMLDMALYSFASTANPIEC